MLKLKNELVPEGIRSALGPNGGVGFFFHATDWETIGFAFDGVAGRDHATEQALWEHGCFIGSTITLDGQVIGANIVSPVPAELWVGRPRATRRFRETQFLPGLQLARECGIEVVALGALMPYACNYGRTKRGTPLPFLTTGHAATAAMMKKTLHRCCEVTCTEFTKADIAIFGAGGMLGRLVTDVLLEDPPRSLRLIELPRNLALLERHRDIVDSPCDVSIHAFTDTGDLPAFHGALLVSNQTAAYLDTAALRRARFWIDDSHPRAATVEAEQTTRHQTLYVECFARGTEGLSTNFPFRLPTFQDCYSCFAEGFVAWRERVASDFIVGIPSASDVTYLSHLLDKHRFSVGPLTGKDGTVLSEMCPD